MNILETISLVSAGFVFGSLVFSIATYRKNKKEIDFLDKKDALIKRLYNQKLELTQAILEQQTLINYLKEIIDENKQT